MKILLYLLAGIFALVVLAVITLFLMGLRRGAGTMATSIELEHPPDAVWPWLTEADKQKQWVSWLVEIRDANPEVTGVGKKVTWIMDDPNMKEKVEIQGELVAEEPGKLLSMRLSSPIGFEGVTTWRLTDLGGRTRLDSEGKFRYGKLLFRLMEPMVTPQARKKQVKDFETLKRLVESGN